MLVFYGFLRASAYAGHAVSAIASPDRSAALQPDIVKHAHFYAKATAYAVRRTSETFVFYKH